MSDNNSSPSRVIVIGAGVSGLACARELKQRRHHVLVLEARHRVGGRLKGMELGTGKVDLGGALIHGISNNPVYTMVKHMGISTRPVSGCLLMDQRGWPVDVERDEHIAGIFNRVLEETFQQSKNGKQGTFGTLFDSLAQPELEKLSEEDQHLFEWHKANLEVSCGASFGSLGHRWNDDEPYGYDGDHVALEPSWDAVVDGLKEGLTIRYGAQVREIKLVRLGSKGGATAPTPIRNGTSHGSPSSPRRASRRLGGVSPNVRRSSRSNKGVAGQRFSVSHDDTRTQRTEPKTVVHVTLQNGTTLQADSVVCTLPLGVLKLSPKNGGITFDPPLPLPKRAAIEKLGCGLLNKCAMSFPNVFWQDEDFIGVVSETSRFHLMVNHNRPQPLLIFWFGGDFADQVQEWTDVEILQDCLEVLQKATGKVPPTPLDYAVTRWGHEQYSRGAFVYVPPGVDSKELAEMSQPVLCPTSQKPKLLFAGEHTTPFHPSTIHGAYLSGIREAYRLDLAVAPELTNLTFNEEAVYKRTFHVKKKNEKGEKKISHTVTAAKTVLQSPQRKRKKRESGDMMLRKRPRATALYSVGASRNNNSSSKTNGVVVVHGTKAVPSRRSHRSTAGKRLHEQFSPSKPVTAAKEHQQPSHNQDDLTLVRAVESYGKTPEGWDLIHTKVLPGLSLAQIKSRYKRLVARQKKNALVDWSEWVVPKSTHPSEHKNTSGNNRRKSARGIVPRVVVDL